MNRRKVWCTGKFWRDVKNNDLYIIFYNKSFMKNFKPKFKIVDRKRVLKNDSPFRKRYKPQLKGLQALFYQIKCQLAVGLIKF